MPTSTPVPLLVALLLAASCVVSTAELARDTNPICGTVCSGQLDCSFTTPPCNYCVNLDPSASGSSGDGYCGAYPGPPTVCGLSCLGSDQCAPPCEFCNANAQCTTPPPTCGYPCDSDLNCTSVCTVCSGDAQVPGICYEPNASSHCGTTCSTNRDCAGGECSSCDTSNFTCVLPTSCGASCYDDSCCNPYNISGFCSTCYFSDPGSSYGSCVHERPTDGPTCLAPCNSSAECGAGGCSDCVGGLCHRPPQCGKPCRSWKDCNQDSECESCNATLTSVGVCFSPRRKRLG